MEVLKGSSDKELMFLLAGGSQEAFELIYRRHAGQLLRYCHAKIGRREDGEELIHDIFESLWVRRKGLLHVTAIEPYLFAMARYKIVDYIRRSLVRKKFEEHFVLFEAVFDQFEGAAEDSGKLRELIDRSIEDLPARCQLAFRLRLNENLSYREIAYRMNISIKTVEKHISAGLQHLRQTIRNTSYRTG